MSFNGGPLIARGPEFTKVGLETEVKIPWETFKKLLILGPFSIWCFWAFCAVIWMGTILVSGKVGLWRWASRTWWPWMGRWSWIPLALCFLWWASAPTWATIYRYMVETITKQGPMYTPYPSERGRWKPFSKGESYDEYEAEAEAEAVEKDDTVDVNLTEQPKGSKRPQIKVFPKFPNGKKERAFYKAVGAELSAFSEGGAAKHEVSQRQFRKIRDALIKRKCADWKNKRRHKDGVDLFDSGRGLLRARGR